MNLFKIGDKVELINMSSKMNNRVGVIIGYGSTIYNKYICLMYIPYDENLSTGICVMEDQLRKL